MAIKIHLRTILLLFIPLALLSLLAHAILDNRPIPWQNYSQLNLDRHLADGKTVLLFFDADWDATAAYTKNTAFESLRLKRLLRCPETVPMIADCTVSNDEISQIHRDVAKSRTSVVAIFFNGERSEPKILEGIVSENDLYIALTKK